MLLTYKKFTEKGVSVCTLKLLLWSAPFCQRKIFSNNNNNNNNNNKQKQTNMNKQMAGYLRGYN